MSIKHFQQFLVSEVTDRCGVVFILLLKLLQKDLTCVLFKSILRLCADASFNYIDILTFILLSV